MEKISYELEASRSSSLGDPRSVLMTLLHRAQLTSKTQAQLLAFLQGLMRPPWSVRCLRSHQKQDGEKSSLWIFGYKSILKDEERLTLKMNSEVVCQAYQIPLKRMTEETQRKQTWRPTHIFCSDFPLRTAKASGCQHHQNIASAQEGAVGASWNLR